LGWSGGGLDDTLPSDDVIPSLAKFHLLDRGPGPLGFWSDGAVRGGALSGTLGRLICKGSRRLFPLNRAPVVRRSRSTESIPAEYSIPRRFGSPHTRRTGARMRSYSACVRSAGCACIAAGLLEPRTTPPTFAGRRVR
jgi:hypothetical protein